MCNQQGNVIIDPDLVPAGVITVHFAQLLLLPEDRNLAVVSPGLTNRSLECLIQIPELMS